MVLISYGVDYCCMNLISTTRFIAQKTYINYLYVKNIAVTKIEFGYDYTLSQIPNIDFWQIFDFECSRQGKGSLNQYLVQFHLLCQSCGAQMYRTDPAARQVHPTHNHRSRCPRPGMRKPGPCQAQCSRLESRSRDMSRMRPRLSNCGLCLKIHFKMSVSGLYY